MIRFKRDYYFIISLLFILFFGIYVVYDYTQKRNLHSYLELLHETVAGMISSEKDRRQFDSYFEKLFDQAEDDSISPIQLEKLADNIISIRTKKTSLDSADLEKLLTERIKPDSIAWSAAKIFGIAGKKDPNWQALAKRFKKQFSISDSICAMQLSEKNLREQLKKQITRHENLSKNFRKHNTNIKQKIDSLKKQLTFQDGKVKSLTDEQLDFLTKQLQQLKAENKKIISKMDGLEDIQKLLDIEREKVRKELASLDSLNQSRQ